MTEAVTTPVETTETEDQSAVAGFGQEMIDGALGVVMIKDDVVLNTVGKRLGAAAVGMIAGVGLYSRLAVKPALKQLTDDARGKVIDDIPLGSITIGHSA